MGIRAKSRKALAAIAVAVAALAFAGCDWTMFGGDAAQTGSSPDSAINGANVSTLQPLFTVSAPTNLSPPGSFGSPVESGGVVYVGLDDAGSSSSGTLEAFDANGATNCSGSPNQCSPLWTAPTGVFGSCCVSTAPAVANGVVYITTGSPAVLEAFDAKGVTNCSGTPTVCEPLWTAPLNAGTVPEPLVSPPIVTNGMVYVTGFYNPVQGPTGSVEAFDAGGVTNCSGTPKVCQPLWTSAVLDAAYSPPAVANGVLYTTSSEGNVAGLQTTLEAFSANGTTNCSGTPTTCSPLWTASLGTVAEPDTGSPVVSGGVVYDDSANGDLEAFDANGVTNCSGTPASCTPLWTATGAGIGAVANGIVYGDTTSNNQLSAFDANGVTNCSGTPKVCQPLWSYSLPEPIGPYSVANGLVFYGSSFCAGSCSSDPGFDFEAFDAGGVTNCSGTPKVCQPLWTGLAPGTPDGSPAIANGKVYLGENDRFLTDGYLQAWVLPPPTTSVWFPSNNASVSGTELLGAGASAGVTKVQFEVSGGPSNLNDQVVATANLTLYGWLANWNTTTVADGTYTLQSVASYGGEVSGTSPPITVTVSN